MNRSVLLATIVLVLFASFSPSSLALEGCVEESSLAVATARVAGDDWQDISLKKLRTLWPTEISGLNCESDVCHSVWSMDRIIAGHCECCTTFSFKVQTNDDGKRTEHLDEVILNYSAYKRDELKRVARQLVKSMGLSGHERETVGNEGVQNFHWVDPSGSQRVLSSVEIHMTRHGQVWELYLNWGRTRIDPGTAPK